MNSIYEQWRYHRVITDFVQFYALYNGLRSFVWISHSPDGG